MTAEASDLSRTGIALRGIPRRLEPGEVVSLELDLVPGTAPVPIDRAEVVWCRKDTAGLRFVDLSSTARTALDTLTQI